MTKQNLRNGMVIITRDGRERLITDNDVVYNLIKGKPACLLSDYNDDLTSKYGEKFDVVKVYSGITKANLLWERRTTPLFTLAQLQKGDTFETKKGNTFVVGHPHRSDVVTATNIITGYVWNLFDSFVDDDIVTVYNKDGDIVFSIYM